MTADEVKKSIQNYRFYISDYKELSESLKNKDDVFDIFGIGLSSRDEKVSRRLEMLGRKLMIVMESVESTDLAEREWAIVYWIMEGKTISWVAREVLCLSHTHANRVLDSAAEKISNHIKEAYVH